MVVGGGVPSHFCVKPKLRLGQVELRLGWGFDNKPMLGKATLC